METGCRILYCHCSYAQVVPKDVKEEVLRKLTESGKSFDAVADLCRAFEAGADQAAAKSCSGLAPIRAVPGVESLMSRRPSELREAPCSGPPVVPVLAV